MSMRAAGILPAFTPRMCRTSGFDETKTYTARYMLRIHLGMKAHAAYESDYFTKIAVRPMAVDGSNSQVRRAQS